MKSLSCPNRHCPPSRKGDAGVVIRHGFYTTRWGKRRRYQCQICRKTFCSTTGTPYHRLQHRRMTFDEVAAFSVEGLNKSAIARVTRMDSDFTKKSSDESLGRRVSLARSSRHAQKIAS